MAVGLYDGWDEAHKIGSKLTLEVKTLVLQGSDQCRKETRLGVVAAEVRGARHDG